MKKALLIACIWSGVAAAQPGTNPALLPQCSASRTTNCTPKVNGSGSYVPATGGGSGISGLTANTIPKAATSSTIANSSLVDNGSVVSTSEPFQAASFSTGAGGFVATTAYFTGGGTAQAQTVTVSVGVTSLAAGLTFCFLPAAANTAAAPGLVVTGSSAFASAPVTKLGATALVANDLTTTAVACVVYDGTEYQLQNPQTVSSGSSTNGTNGQALTSNGSGGYGTPVTLGTGATATIANYATLASPALTGSPTAPTQTSTDNTTKIATDAFVQSVSYPVANTTVAVSSATQGANSCASATTVTMTGLTTSMVALVGYSASPAALTGWGSTGGMVFQAWPSASNTLSWIVCNQTTSSITYSAITFNVGAR